jgi:hypothetical protein
MKPAPQNFLTGLIDFFAVLLPGMALTYVADERMDYVLERLGINLHTFGDGERWAVFLFVGYLTGHFVFLVGSKLDEYFFDRIRQATPGQQRHRVGTGRSAALPPTRWLARLLFGSTPDVALERTLELKKRRMRESDGKPVASAYEWSMARLTTENPLGHAEVRRLEVEATFFRSFAVVLALVTAYMAAKNLLGVPDVRITAMFALALALALWRYVERYYTATQHAYRLVLTLDAEADSVGTAGTGEARTAS